LENTLIYLLKRLLKENKIKVDEKELEFQFQSHPSYPSLHSLTGVLSHFKVNHLALEIPQNIETLNKLPKSFIAYIKDKKNDDLVLVTLTDSNIRLVFDKNKERFLSADEFLEAWTGIIVAIEKDEEILVKNTTKDFLKVFAPVTVLVLLALFFSFKPTLFQSVHFLLSFIGFGISIVIVKHELGFHSAIADKFCSGNIDKINCDDVLNSKAASFFGTFKLSDVGIIYFIAVILSWLLLIVNNANYDPLILITALAIPFTFYSIIYQYFVVKKWCLLCLSIVLTLWLQAASLYFVNFGIADLSININSIALIVFSFLLTTSLWQFVLPKLNKEQELKKLKIEHFKFKRNYGIFDALISRSVAINTAIQDIEEIVFGNKNSNAPLKIVVITNPLCGHCKSAHKVVEQLLELKENNIQISIRFNVNTKDENSIAIKIALRLLELYHLKREQECLEAMQDIYGKLAPTIWLEKWGEAKNQKYIGVLNAESHWCEQNNINFTPEILVNGRSFPMEYDRSDLIYFVDDIIEEEIEESAPEFELTT
jgi:uncharacterized membrane protein